MADQKARIYLSGWSSLTHTDISSLVGKTLSSAEQSLLTTLIAELELTICRRCNRQFKYSSQTYYETVNAGEEKYFLKSIPVLAVTKITLDGSTIYELNGNNNTLTLNQDFFVFRNYVQFASVQSSSVDNRNALVIYYTLEQFYGDEIKLAMKRYLAELFLQREYGTKPVQSLGISGGLDISFDSRAIPDYLEKVINFHKLRNV